MRKPNSSQTTSKPPTKTARTRKKTQNASARSGSVYDRMIKENFEKSLKTIIQDIGGLKILQSKPLPTKMQHTKERDPDELSLIQLIDGSEKITTRLNKLAKTVSQREKYYTQLRVLSNIRKLQPIIEKIMENIFKLIDISEDPLYVKGIKEGEDRGAVKGKLEGKLEGKYEAQIESVESLINTDFDDERIAFIMALPTRLVTEIRDRLAKTESIKALIIDTKLDDKHIASMQDVPVKFVMEIRKKLLKKK